MTRPHALFAVQVTAMAVIVALAFVLSTRWPVRFDLTPDAMFSLSAHTRAVLTRLTHPIGITYYFSSQEAVIRRNAAELLSLYATENPRLTVRLLDLDRNPGAAERDGVSSYNVTILEGDGERLRLDLLNEEVLTAAILRLVDHDVVPTYVLQGHGERPIGGDARRGLGEAMTALTREGFVLHPLRGAAAIPDDARLVVLAGPTHDLADVEIEALDAWVRAGGGLLALVDAPTPPSVRALLARYGIVPSDDVVVDLQGRLLGGDGLSARVPYVNQSLIPTVPEVAALLPVAQSVRLDDAPGIESDYVAVTDESAWADVDRSSIETGGRESRGPDDRAGPLPIAAFARTTSGAEHAGRVLFVGDADFATNLHFDVLGNRELFLSLAALAGEKPTTLDERPTSLPPSPLSAFVLTAKEARLLLVLGSIAPAFLLALGAFMAYRRRRA